MAPCGPWGAKGVLVNSVCVMLGPALPLQKGRFRAQDCRNRVDSWTLGLQWSERALFGGLGGDPGSQRGSWGDIGGSTDACGSYLPTAGKYGSPGSFVPQARPLNERAAIWMCIGEAGMLGA